MIADRVFVSKQQDSQRMWQFFFFFNRGD
uniref:Uncharacterized protein n=1 Tax=Rhizophora mucronata TaxID=61149 RepID=A0A2P2P8E7_RHIMU